jgi:hypothetical protein
MEDKMQKIPGQKNFLKTAAQANFQYLLATGAWGIFS